MTYPQLKNLGNLLRIVYLKLLGAIYNPINDDKLREKFDEHKTLENLEALCIKKCKYDIKGKNGSL